MTGQYMGAVGRTVPPHDEAEPVAAAGRRGGPFARRCRHSTKASTKMAISMMRSTMPKALPA